MGLDISVNVSPAEILEGLKYDDCGVKHPETARRILETMQSKNTISTRTGSYSGLHVLRKLYTNLKGLMPEPLGQANAGIPTNHDNYHLLNHCDATGWYLPDDFESPVWAGNTSIGSSIRLLAELEELELERANQPNDNTGWGWRWDALYIAAVASVVCRCPIKFH